MLSECVKNKINQIQIKIFCDKLISEFKDNEKNINEVNKIDRKYYDKLVDVNDFIKIIESYKEKNADNEAKKVYDKYYKRYSARLKVFQIKEKDFKQWQYKAITMRDECIDGKITLQEYIDWNESAFPNRTKKS